MSDGFPNLLETFNAAAQAVREERLPVPIFVTHYLTAVRHGTSEADERRNLTATMFDSAFNKLDFFADAANAQAVMNVDIKPALNSILDAVCSPECIDYLPRDAARKLAGVVMKASASAAQVNFEKFSRWDHLEAYQAQISALAALALNYADVISKPRPDASVETSKDIAPAKRITLKPAEGAQP